jgi:hypothetical protein
MAKTPKYLLVGGCPAPYEIAAQIDLVTKRAKSEVSSIYRGQDPAATPLLHRYGHHTQKELVHATPTQRRGWGVTGVPNPYNRSQHELRDDFGREIPVYQQGVDSGPNTDANRRALRAAAAHYGWKIIFPYNSAVEYHHWQFVHPPTSNKHIKKATLIARRLALRVSTRRQMRGHW